MRLAILVFLAGCAAEPLEVEPGPEAFTPCGQRAQPCCPVPDAGGGQLCAAGTICRALEGGHACL